LQQILRKEPLKKIGEIKMAVTRTKNIFLLLVFALIIGCFQTPVVKAAEQNQVTISVFGNVLTGVVSLETTMKTTSNITALEALSNTLGANNLEYSESTYGKMITGINGLQATGNFYWAFYINGLSAQIGADQYIVQDGDRLSFRYQDWTLASENNVSIKVVGNKGLMKEVANIPFTEEPTAFQLLQVVYGDKLKFSESQYGKMITSIDGLEMAGTNYWAFYVNGVMSSVGADTYLLKTGDQISFQYESWETPGKETSPDTNEEASPGKSTAPNLPISATKLQKAIDVASQYVRKNQVGEWEAIALQQAGKELPVHYLDNVTKLVKDKNGRFSKITEYERYTLGILAAGGNPTNVAGYNLIESIYNGEIAKQGLNGVFYGLIALDSAKFDIPKSAKWSREKLVSQLLEKQNKDNGWSWDGSGKSDIDTTAMVITALSPYKEQTDVKAAIDLAVQYLLSHYQTGKIDNSSTAAQVVIGLSSIGVDANSTVFTKDGISLFMYLLSFQNVDGGFDWQGGSISDVFSTSQGFQGLVSYQLFVNGKGALYQLPLFPEITSPEAPNSDATPDATPDSNSVVNDGEEGKPLPNTATNTYNYLLVGFLLILMGIIFFIIDRRKKV
jgi:LPXTG-motif cell wall-anchored protein